MIYMGEEEERLSKVFDAISKILSLLIVFSFIPILIRTFTAITPKYRETISITSLEDLTDYLSETVEYSLMYPLLLTSQDILTDYLSETIDITLWLDGWSYRKSAIIQGSTNGSVTDYQIRLIVHYGSGEDSGEHVYLNGKCRADFGDIRFTDSDGTLLNYWVEEKVDGDYAKIWVKIPYIPISPNTTLIYVYYGKSDATSISNGDNTFMFFDDFESGSLYKWSRVSNASVVDDGTGNKVLELIAIGHVEKDISHSNVSVEFKYMIKAVGSYGPRFAVYIRRIDAYNYYEARNEVGASDYGHKIVKYVGGTPTKLADNDVNTYTANVWYRNYFKAYSNRLYALIAQGPSLSATDTTFSSGSIIRFDTWDTGNRLWLDNVFLRNFIDPEPSIIGWGSEESL